MMDNPTRRGELRSPDISVYVHIPYCLSKCGYCDFLSFAGKEDTYSHYVNVLTNEIERKASAFQTHTVRTIFFGGGTPTLLGAEQLCRVLRVIRKRFAVAPDAEITTEANPETAGFVTLSALRQGGFNRVSFGVQSFQDGELQTLGRAHNARKALEAVGAARTANFENVSLDLMFALPGQTAETWARTLSQAVALQPKHISCYGLTVEDGTPFATRGVQPLDDDTDREMYHYAQDFLSQNGYQQYELSNFAKTGYACKHNLVYWTGGGYVGLGLGAHSFVGGERYRNTENLDDYLSGDFSLYEKNTLTESDRMAEYMFLGLRLTEGVAEADFAARFGAAVDSQYGAHIADCARNGLLTRDGGRLRLTPFGMDVSNRVFAGFV